MQKFCEGCDGPLCSFCGGCIAEGECVCHESPVPYAIANIGEQCERIANALEAIVCLLEKKAA